MTESQRVLASKKISKIDWNKCIEPIHLKTYWCRVAFNQFETWNYKQHRHSFFELHLCLNGMGEFEIDGKILNTSKNTFILIPPNKSHRFTNASDDFEKFVWGFAVEDHKISSSLIHSAKIACVKKMPEPAIIMVESILKSANESRFESYNFSKNCLYNIFVQLTDVIADVRNTSIEPKMKNGTLTSHVRKYILDNLLNDMHFSDVAENFFMSERQLSRIFKEETGMTFREIKAQIQAEQIKKLLLETEFTLSEIASQTGFSDRYSLSKFFKKQEGMTPAELRSAIKK